MAAILTIREDGTRGFTVYGPAEENERDTAQQRTRRVVRCVFIQHGRLCVLTQGLSKGQHAVFCVGQCGRRIDFTLYPLFFPVKRPNPSVPPLDHEALFYAQPRHFPRRHLNPYPLGFC